ncbi:hypothetical protein DFH29DRAFT_871632 [Suillus ampliporus]|nr:hypothetical protein DFH29DRAFT_871632 [Suillus ampliporus]
MFGFPLQLNCESLMMLPIITIVQSSIVPIYICVIFFIYSFNLSKTQLFWEKFLRSKVSQNQRVFLTPMQISMDFMKMQCQLKKIYSKKHVERGYHYAAPFYFCNQGISVTTLQLMHTTGLATHGKSHQIHYQCIMINFTYSVLTDYNHNFFKNLAGREDNQASIQSALLTHISIVVASSSSTAPQILLSNLFKQCPKENSVCCFSKCIRVKIESDGHSPGTIYRSVRSPGTASMGKITLLWEKTTVSQFLLQRLLPKWQKYKKDLDPMVALKEELGHKLTKNAVYYVLLHGITNYDAVVKQK